MDTLKELLENYTFTDKEFKEVNKLKPAVRFYSLWTGISIWQT
ncbi:hypothetical protein [Desulfurobacterium sp.]